MRVMPGILEHAYLTPESYGNQIRGLRTLISAARVA
jgi:hypothetical protein